MGDARGTGWLERVETQLTLVPGECTIQEELPVNVQGLYKKKSWSVEISLWSAPFRGSWRTVQRVKPQEQMRGGGIEEHARRG